MKDPQPQPIEDGRVSSSETMDGLEALLARHAAANRKPDDEGRIKMLSRAQLRGWVQYPQQGDTPHNVRERGRRLTKALAEGDVETIALLGVKRGCSGKVATTKDRTS